MENAKSASRDECARMREKYYQDLDILHEEYDTFLHDMKHTMRAIAALAREGEVDEIISLIDKLDMSLGRIEQGIFCSNKVLNALLSERKSYAEEAGVVMEYDITEPLYFEDIDDVDLCSLVGNILDNAIEAEKQSAEPEGIWFRMKMAREGCHIIIQLENSYNETEENDKIRTVGTERVGAKRGIGLRSVRKIVRQYGGMMEDRKEDGRFRIKILLPVRSGWNN